MHRALVVFRVAWLVLHFIEKGSSPTVPVLMSKAAYPLQVHVCMKK